MINRLRALAAARQAPPDIGAQIVAAWEASPFRHADRQAIAEALAKRACLAAMGRVHPMVAAALGVSIQAFVDECGLFERPYIQAKPQTDAEHEDLEAWLHVLQDRQSLLRWRDSLLAIHTALARALPRWVLDQTPRLTRPMMVSAMALLQDPFSLIETVLFELHFSEHAPALHRPWCLAIDDEIKQLGGAINLSRPDRPITDAARAKHGPAALAGMLFRATPAGRLLSMPVPVAFPLSKRLAHTAVVGPSGSGKSTLTEHLLAYDMQDIARGAVTSVVLCTNGQLSQRLLQQAALPPDRFVILDPADPNLRPQADILRPAPLAGNAGTGQAAEAVAYCLEALDITFSGMQGQVLRYLAEAADTNPSIDLEAIRAVCRRPDQWRDHFEQLSPGAKEYFEQDFGARALEETRAAVSRRLQDLRSAGPLGDMFAHRGNSLDWRQLLDSGRLVIVRLDKARLGNTWVKLCARWLVASLNAAMRARPTDGSGPAWLIYFDEILDATGAGTADSMLEGLIYQARKYRVGLVINGQNFQQMGRVGHALKDNSAVKVAGRLASAMAGAMAHDMGCSADLFQQCRVEHQAGRAIMALQVDELVPRGTLFSLPFGPLGARKRSDAQIAQMMAQQADLWAGLARQAQAANAANVVRFDAARGSAAPAAPRAGEDQPPRRADPPPLYLA